MHSSDGVFDYSGSRPQTTWSVLAFLGWNWPMLRHGIEVGQTGIKADPQGGVEASAFPATRPAGSDLCSSFVSHIMPPFAAILIDLEFVDT